MNKKPYVWLLIIGIVATILLCIILPIRKYHLGRTKRFKKYIDKNRNRLIYNLRKINVPEYDIVGVMVEPRNNFKKVIDYFRKVLPDIPIQFYHGTMNAENAIKEYEDDDMIELINVGIENFDYFSYNLFMTSTDFWYSINGKQVITFQTDSVVHKNSKFLVDDFKPYDYIGAPFKSYSAYFVTFLDIIIKNNYKKYSRVGNGGFSWRTRDKCIEISKKWPFEKEPFFKGEDWYFMERMRDVNGVFPSIDIAKTFSHQYCKVSELPFGSHRTLPKNLIDQITDEEISIMKKYDDCRTLKRKL